MNDNKVTASKKVAKNLKKTEQEAQVAVLAAALLDAEQVIVKSTDELNPKVEDGLRAEVTSEAEVADAVQITTAGDVILSTINLGEFGGDQITLVAKKDECRINDKGEEECDGFGWGWLLMGLPLLALGGGGGGGSSPAPTPPTPTSFTFRHVDFAQDRAPASSGGGTLDDDVLNIHTTAYTTINVVLDGSEHLDTENVAYNSGYNQSINFDESDNIATFGITVTDADAVKLSVDYTGASDLTHASLTVNEGSYVYADGGQALINLNKDNATATVSVVSGGVYVSGGNQLVDISGDHAVVNVSVDGDSELYLEGSGAANINVNGDDAHVALDVTAGGYLFVNSGGVTAIDVSGDRAHVDVTIDDAGFYVASGGGFVELHGANGVVNFSLNNGASGAAMLSGGTDFIGTVGTGNSVNLSVTESSDLLFSGGSSSSGANVINMVGNHSAATVELSSSGGITLTDGNIGPWSANSGSYLVAVTGNNSTVDVSLTEESYLWISSGASGVFVRGNDADVNISSVGTSWGGNGLHYVSGGAALVNVIGSRAHVDVTVGDNMMSGGANSSGGIFLTGHSGGGSGLVSVKGNDATVDINLDRNGNINSVGTDNADVHVVGNNATLNLNAIMSAPGDSDYTRYYKSGSGAILEASGKDATFNFNVQLDSDYVRIENHGGAIISGVGNDHTVNFTIDAIGDVNAYGDDISDQELSVKVRSYASGGSGGMVNLTGDRADVHFNVTYSPLSGPFVETSGGVFLDTEYSGGSLVQITGRDAHVDMNLTGAVHVSGGGITRVLGDNATINVVAHDTESDAFFSGGASWGLNDGILVQGANASVTLDVEGRLQSNNNSFGISWNGSGGSALVDVYGSDANINVAIDNAFLSGGYVVRANGDDAVVNLSTFNADGYYSGVEVVGNRADVTYTATWNWTNDYHYPSSGGYMPSALNLVGSDATFDLNFVNYSKGAMTGSFVNVDGDTNLGSVSLIDVSLDINGYTVPWIEAQTGGASVLTVSGTDNTIDFVMQSVDISGGSAPWSDGSSPVFNMIGNANTVHVDAIDTNISNSGGAFLKINGDDNEFILDVAGVPHGTAYSYIDGANSRINGDNNTVDVNFNHHSEGYISLLMDGDDNTFNVDAHTDNTYPSGGSNLHASGSVYVGVDVSNGVGNVINITADHSAVGFDNTGWTSGGITVTGDTYDTTINIDMVNQAYVTGDIDLLSGGYFNTYNEYDTINIDSTSSLFDIKITQDGYHGAVVNVDNNMIHNYSGGATNVATFNSVLELVSNGSGGITLNMDPGAHDINTIVSGTNGYVELSASTAYQDGNDDYLFAEASNNLYVDNWEGWNDDKIILGNTSDFAYFYANDLGSGGYYDAVNSYTVSGGNAMWALQEFGWDRSLGYTGDNGGVYDYTNQDNNITAVIYGYNLDASLGSWNPEFDYGGGSEAAAWYFGAEIFVVSDEGSSLDVWQWNVYNNQWDLRLEVNIGSFDPMNYHWDSLSEILIHQNQMPATFTV